MSLSSSSNDTWEAKIPHPFTLTWIPYPKTIRELARTCSVFPEPKTPHAGIDTTLPWSSSYLYSRSCSFSEFSSSTGPLNADVRHPPGGLIQACRSHRHLHSDGSSSYISTAAMFSYVSIISHFKSLLSHLSVSTLAPPTSIFRKATRVVF